MATPMLAAQGRGVVDSVAGHGDDLARVLKGLDDLHLVLGGYPGEDRHVVHHRLQLR